MNEILQKYVIMGYGLKCIEDYNRLTGGITDEEKTAHTHSGIIDCSHWSSRNRCTFSEKIYAD